MPYHWEQTEKAPDMSGAFLHLTLWPYRSLGAKGFVTFIAATAILAALPVLALVGTIALWVILTFSGAAIAFVWMALRVSNRALTITEDLTLTADLIRVTRRDPDGTTRRWQANPYWVRVTLYPLRGQIQDYLTLTGGEREIELGAFLTPSERRALASELREAISQLRCIP